MTNSPAVLKFLRKVHLYIGIFISPALLFFAFTGALQTFSLHETTKGSSYQPPQWAVTLAQLHKKQTTEIPVRKPGPAPEKPGADKAASAPPAEAAKPAPASPPAPAPPPAPKLAPKRAHLPMKIFFLGVALGLFTSTLTGIYMAYKFDRNRWLVSGLLLAGVVVPLMLLLF